MQKAMTVPSHGMGMWPQSRSFDPDASIVLVGSRGCGKRSLGFIAATKLGRPFITEDRSFEMITGLSRGTFLKTYGNEKFYRQSVEVLSSMLFENRRRYVIECGMSSLAGEAQLLLREYSKTNPVIYVVRNPMSISRLLKLDDCTAQRLASADVPHTFCSNLEYYNLYDATCKESNDDRQDFSSLSPMYSSKLKNAKEDFSYYLDFITGRCSTQLDSERPFSITTTPAELRAYTYAVPVKLSDLLSGTLDLDQLESTSGADVIEMKVDIQPPKHSKSISKLIALIRRHIQAPIIFVVESQVKRSLGEESYFEVLNYSLRLGLEYVAVDINSSLENIQQLIVAKGRTKVIGDYFDERQDCYTAWSDSSMLKQYLKAESLGCDIVRLVLRIAKGDDIESIRTFRHMIKSMSHSTRRPPLIAYSLGHRSHASLVSNPTFTPITTMGYLDPAITTKQDPQLLTAREITQELLRQRILDPLQFYIIGESVFYSLSPVMHNAAYRVYGMNHNYSICQSSSVDELQQLIKDNAFGGAAISNPFKVEVKSLLTVTSKDALNIGAVNTVLPIRDFPDGSIPNNSPNSLVYQANQRGKAGTVIGCYGDNTDWIGVMKCLQKNMLPRNAVTKRSTGLVIGAGGMARATIYAMIKLGCRRIFIFNRTIQNAQRVAEHFNTLTKDSHTSTDEPLVEVLQSRDDPWPEGLNPPTMIVSAIPANSIENRPAAKFELPTQWLTSPSGGVVIELAYKPLITPLIEQIQVLCKSGLPWVAVDGLEVLPEQGIAQFELMTGKRAPRGTMKLEVLKRYQEESQTAGTDE